MDRRVVRRLSRWQIARLWVIGVATLCGAWPVSPVRAQASAPAHTNRLIDSANPYLLQHAHNPVDWYPWGAEAIARAKAENKPIFLSIGYSTCYWCHVAQRTVYSDPVIAALMNAWFINIKVDREERPDIDQSYMAARHILSGNGGWPNNLFLTPDLEPISASGHVPAEDQDGRPGFGRVLRLIHERWEADPQQLTAIAKKVHAALSAQRQVDATRMSAARPYPVKWLADARTQLLRRHDSLAGGFYSPDGSKFPLCPALDLLLTDYRERGSADSCRQPPVPSPPSHLAVSTTISAVGYIATPLKPRGRSRTSRRCSTTTLSCSCCMPSITASRGSLWQPPWLVTSPNI